MKALLATIGRPVVNVIVYMTDLLGLLYGALLAVSAMRTRGLRVVVRTSIAQIRYTGVQGLFPVVVATMAVGTLIQSQALEYLPAEYVIRVSVLIIVREATPILTALILILRSGTAISIEIAQMKLSHELDALSVMGIPFEHFVMVPRLVGMVVSFVALQTFAIASGVLLGYEVTRLVSAKGVTFPFVSLMHAMTVDDVMLSLVKACIFGAVIALTCVQHGLLVRYSRREIPIVTMQAVVRAMLACLLLNTLISVFA